MELMTNKSGKPNKPERKKFNNKTIKQVDPNLIFNFKMHHQDKKVHKNSDEMNANSKRIYEDAPGEEINVKHHYNEQVEAKFEAISEIKHEFEVMNLPMSECYNVFEILEVEEVKVEANEKMQDIDYDEEKNESKKIARKKRLRGEKLTKAGV